MAGKVAFVTGAGSGIGRATAKMFAARGYSVAVADVAEPGGRETEDMMRQAGGEGFFIRCDVADDASVKAAVEATVARYGGLNAAFNAAGIGGEVGLATGGLHDGQLAPDHGDQPHRGVALHAPPDPGDAGERRRSDRQLRFHCRNRPGRSSAAPIPRPSTAWSG